jgi:hypothetical protein
VRTVTHLHGAKVAAKNDAPIPYAKRGLENRTTDFGQNIRKGEGTKIIGIVNLSVALAMFESAYNQIGDLTADFTKICERFEREKR